MSNNINLSIRLKNIQFNNPVFAASGTFGYGEEYNQIIDINKLGGIFTKALTIKEQQGNEGLRIAETPSGLINRIGLQNVGIEKFIKEKIPFFEKLKTKIIVNIAGFTENEFVELVNGLNNFNVISGYEINVSCPNVKQGGIAFSCQSDTFQQLILALRKQTEKIIIVKLSPSEGNIFEYAKFCEQARIDAITVANTFKSAVIDIKKQTIKIKGGLSGPAVFPIILNLILELRQNVKIPIFASGGIFNTDTGIQFLLAGAMAVQIGTINFVEPNISLKIIKGIKDYLQKQNIQDVNDIIGKVKI